MEPNTGSFGAGQIDTSAVREAMARRQQGSSSPALGQTSAQPAQTPQLGQPSAQPSPQPSPGGSPQGGPEAMSPAESELIVKALSQRLSSISSVEKSSMQPSPMGGGYSI